MELGLVCDCGTQCVWVRMNVEIQKGEFRIEVISNVL